MRYLLLNITILFFIGCGGNVIVEDTTYNSNIGTAGSRAKFVISKEHLYTINRFQLNIFDLSIPSNPEYISKISIPFTIETIFPYKDYLYMGARDGFYIYSIKDDPALPSYINRFRHFNAQDPIVVYDDIAYVTLHNIGDPHAMATSILAIYDIKDPNNIKEIKEISMFNSTGLAVDNNKLFVCDGDSGLKMFDIDKNEINSSIEINLKLLYTIKEIDCFDVIAKDGILVVSDKNFIYQFEYNNSTLKEISKI